MPKPANCAGRKMHPQVQGHTEQRRRGTNTDALIETTSCKFCKNKVSHKAPAALILARLTALRGQFRPHLWAPPSRLELHECVSDPLFGPLSPRAGLPHIPKLWPTKTCAAFSET